MPVIPWLAVHIAANESQRDCGDERLATDARPDPAKSAKNFELLVQMAALKRSVELKS